jgi:hypothetical protein
MTQEPHVREEDAAIIIDALAGYSLPEQVGCLMSLIFSHVTQACGDLHRADQVMQQLIAAFPAQWRMTKALVEMEMTAPTGLPN